MYFGLNDYFRLAIEWLPPIIVSYVLGIFIDKFFTRVERGATEEYIAARSPYPRFTRWSRKWSQDSIVLVLVIGAILNITLTFFVAGTDYMCRIHWCLSLVQGDCLVCQGTEVHQELVCTVEVRDHTFSDVGDSRILLCSLRVKPARTSTLRPADVQISLQGESTPVTGRMLFLLDQYVVLQGQKTISLQSQRTK